MRTEQQETGLTIWGGYEIINPQSKRFIVKLMDQREIVDTLEFGCSQGKVWTAAGYTKDTAGARQQARDYWF